MKAFVLREITLNDSPVLDNMLQLYAHEMNVFFDYSIALDRDCRYRIKSAAKYLADGWGYLIIANRGYAGFILLNRRTKAHEGVFIEEFFIFPRYRNGFFCRDIIFRLFASLKGTVEYRVLKNNRRAMSFFEFLAKRSLLAFDQTEETENGMDYFRFTLDTASIILDDKR